MGFRVQTFWVEDTGLRSWTLTASHDGPCTVHGKEHRAEVLLPDAPKDARHANDMYPQVCACGFRFEEGDFGGTGSAIYRRKDTGEVIRGALQPGALLEVEAMTHQNGYRLAGADDKCIVCVTPGGWWYIDSRCSNCGSPNDNVHKCWVRHGTVGDRLTVDKNGKTCSAGGGSIQTGGFHGFLKNGELYEC